jgi:glycosyltransferase involved in cell wall biosynthesis
VTPLVSIITPTYGREAFLAHARRWVEAQTHPRIEWLVLDDSPEPSTVLARPNDPRIRYWHVTERLSIGEKRNRLIAAAAGEYIAHFDDDDYYAPNYLETMVGQMSRGGAHFVNLCSWYLFDLRHDFFGYWALRQTTGLHYLCYGDGLRLAVFTPENNAALASNYLGYGFSYVYRREIWEAQPFGHIDRGEDAVFVDMARRRFRLLHIEDQSGLALHILHPGSSSSCFPQHHLPTFLLPTLFAEPRRFLSELRAQRDSVGH